MPETEEKHREGRLRSSLENGATASEMHDGWCMSNPRQGRPRCGADVSPHGAR